MKTFQKIFLFLALIAGVFIFYISSLSYTPNPFPTTSLISILYHFGIFFLFALFLTLGLGKNYFFLIILSGVYAGLDELHQYFVPNRVADIFDFGIDFSGIVFGVVCAIISLELFKRCRN
jgi:VanZ family protein